MIFMLQANVAMKSLEHLNDNMSDSDSDVPALVPSSDEEDDVKVIKTNDECVDIWLSKNVKFLEKQEHNIHIFSLGPFIMGLETFISKPWMFCLNDAKLLVDKVYREKTEYSKLTDDEWANLDILDVVTKLVVKKMRRRKFLVNTLNMIDKIEEFNRGDGIDVKHSIQTATRYNHINDFVWDKALILPQLRDKQQKVKFAALYVCKLCHMVITSLAREGKDIAEDFKKSIRAKCGGVEKALDFKDQGNQQYSQQKYSEAIRLYTDAIKADHFNHLCYGNRAQAYQKLENYQEALADGRRAVLMKPDWIKGYYRYSQAFYHTGKIDMAIAINKKGMRICEKTKNNDKMLSELKDQGQKLQFQKDGVASDEVLHQMIKNNRMDDSVPEQIRNFPGCTVINIESAMSQWSQKRFSQDPSVLLSSDDHDSSEEESVLVPYSEAKKKIVESRKQAKDPEVEKLHLNKTQGKKSQKGRKVNQTGERQTKPVATEPTPIPVQEKVKEKIVIVQKNENKEIERYMAEGSSAYLNGLGKKAVASYQKALDLLSNKKAEDFGLDQQDVAVLEYAYGLADISTGIYKHILDGIERLKNITETHKDIRLPLPYFGLGKAYITLNRFEEAIDPLNRCLRMAGTLKLNVLTWPGTDTKMEESISDELQKQVKQLLTLTKYPPVPDAVCKIHTDMEDSRALIFFSDPDFKGFVRIVCLTSCIVEFHNHCWKDFKSKYGEKTGDKDILEKPCPTPDCMSCIVKVIIIKQDSLQKEITADKTEHVASKPKKPALKLPPSSQDKIEKRKEKKELRKQRKRESKEEAANDLMDDIESISALPTVNEQCSITSIEDPVSIDADNENVSEKLKPEADVTVVKQQTQEYKGSKPKATKKKAKKKKDKGKQVLNVEVNFGDDGDKQLLGEDYVEEEKLSTPAPSIPKEEEFIMQQSIKKQFVPKASAVTPALFDEIAKNLFSFFEDLLKAHGPLHINDAKITTMLEDFPPDAKVRIETAGGLNKFLLQSTKFAMHGEIVCMREDAHKASKISRQQSESFASKASKLKSNSDTTQSGLQKQENVWTNGKVLETKELKQQDNIPKVASDPELTDLSGMKSKVSKTSYMDTLDDFDYPEISFDKTVEHSKKNVEKTIENVKKNSEKTIEYPKIPVPEKNVEKPQPSVERSVAMDMDELDDIDLIPVTRKSKKKKKNKCMDDLDDFDWSISESDNFKENTAISDVDSIGSKDELSKIVGREKMDLNKLERRNEKQELKTEFSMSQSSSKSDLSERSDLSAELKGVKQKMPELKPPPVAKSMWPTRERTLNSSPNNFGPIGSPVPLEKCENRGEQSDSVPSYTSYLNDKNSSLLLMDTAIAAEREKYRIDSKLVQELTDQVMNDMTFGKNLTETERKDLYKQVSQDIWNDFKRTKKTDQWTPKTTETGYEYTVNKKSFNEEYMKKFYQKKTTDPNLNSLSFAVVTSSNYLYGDTTFSNNISSANSGWPTSVNDSLGYTNYQTNLASTTSSSFSPLTSNVSAFPSMTTTPSLFSPLTSNSGFQSPFSMADSKQNLFGNWSIGISVTQTTSSFTSTSSQPLNTFPGNYTSDSSVFSNSFHKKFNVDRSVQCVVETCTIAMNTEPYEPLKEEFQRMKKEYDLLQGDLTSALTQKQELASHVQELNHRFKTFDLEVNIKNEAIGKERQSMQEKHDMLYLEWNHLNQQLSQYAENEIELKARLSKIEEDYQELLNQKSKDRLELKFAEDEFKKKQEEYKMLFDREKDRAARAETELTTLKKQSSVTMLERSKKEAMYHVHHLKGLHKKHTDQGKEVPTQMSQALSFYETIVSKCAETIPKMMSDFDEQITQIQNGRCLAELPPVFVPPPPPAFSPNSGGLDTKLEESLSKVAESTPPKLPSSSSGLSPISVKGPTSQPSVSLPAQPKPLIPPPGLQTQSLRQQIPRLANNKAGQVNGQAKNSFEKLVQRLTTTFPQYNRAIFTQLIQQLRQNRGGSLSGLTIDEITQQVTLMVQAHEQKQNKTQAAAAASSAPKAAFPGQGPVKPVAPPPGLNTSWGFTESSNTSSYKGEEVFEEEQDPCVICHEEMTPDTTVRLECHHRFHDECIRKWLKENSTCPNCRIYALLPDEFPTLN
ncbi:uncharacterized protein LOC143079699 isoform X1 [Mytilus galloprovincialis]|uniref:uncharacterized protein LOC143079699 isoform X1 n=3 Tax=Mytilus galloprovincialis TaxID=29158 RepID=UPI003F7C2899